MCLICTEMSSRNTVPIQWDTPSASVFSILFSIGVLDKLTILEKSSNLNISLATFRIRAV